MIVSKIFHRKTRRGNVVKVVREHYLREDIGCGIHECTLGRSENNLCADPNDFDKNLCKISIENLPNSFSLIVANQHIIIIDTNVALHQMDILEDDSIKNVVVPQTVVDELKHRSPPAYKKLKELFSEEQKHFYYFPNEFHKDTYVERIAGESSNDRNDRAVRKVVEWYQNHFKLMKSKVKCVLLSDDQENLKKTRSNNLLAYSVQEYVKGITNRPELLDKLAAYDNVSTTKSLKIIGKILFPEHKPLSELKNGLKSGAFCQGSFQQSRDNFYEGTVFVQADKHDEIFIQGIMNINRAVHDDVVVVEILPEDQWSCPAALLKLNDLEGDKGDELNDEEDNELKKALPKKIKTHDVSKSGRIIGILKRNWRPYCGMLDVSPVEGSMRHLFIPAERRIPRIRIETRQAAVLAGQRIVVCIDSWARDSRYPSGHFVKALGAVGDRLTETEVILLEHDVPHESFSESVLACLPELPWTISEEDFKARKDLRHLDVCSVDPPGCTDIDDALHCRNLPNGRFEVGVHIADVSHFVKHSTAMDLEASKRGTTVYLIGKRIDMLPTLLSSNLCSLRGGEERFAFSVLWELTSNAEIISTTFTKSLIKSKAALTYAEAQMRMDDPSRNDNVTTSLRHLNDLAKTLKEKRRSNGALTLASLEIRFNIDSETHDPIDVEAKKVLETNSLVEEFMLLANISVAQKIFEEFPNYALLRRHPAPPISNYKPLIKAAASRGFEIIVDSGKALAQSLDRTVLPENPYFNTMLRILTTRCMTQAVYFCSGTLDKQHFYHFGLASPIYTHFTSPIRRYADLLVHRLLAATIHGDETYPDLLDKKKQELLCKNLNYRHNMAQLAGRSSVLMNTHLFFKNRIEDLEGYILSVRKNALQILVPKYGLESAIMLKRNSQFVYDEENGTLASGDVVLQTFDKVVVQLSVDSTDLQHRKLTLRLVQPKIDGFSVEPLFAGPDEKSDEPVNKKRKR